MKEKLRKLIELNPTARFVFHTRTTDELNGLFEILEEKGYSPIPPISLEQLKDNAVEEYGFQASFCCNPNNMSVSFNTPSHWLQYTNDVIEWDKENEKFYFINDGQVLDL